jgi:hypothetical protein
MSKAEVRRCFTMRKVALRFLGLALVATALASAAPSPAQAQVCNLLCAKGLRCCLDANGAAFCAKHC